MKSKPLTEVLTGIYLNELHARAPNTFQHWDNTSDHARGIHMVAMHSVVEALQLFNLEIKVNGAGVVSTERIMREPTEEHVKQLPPVTAISPMKMTHVQAIQSGFTGESCVMCESMQMVRNGTCSKCVACGSTSGCS